ncbi:hypothetical protein SAMN04489707_100670 [Paenacidovorax caeni]|uniref:Uncharacterized protein n=1 Tax=Paenacidovorax caeni TaxID=343013 RepID=A0A1I7GP07_9BURK|nr:hypothetical protein SAMN04489707_100670 [Paenacidovorax caeni]
MSNLRRVASRGHGSHASANVEAFASNVFMTFAWCLRPRNGDRGSGKAHGCARCGYCRQKNTAAITSPVATMPQRSTGAGSRRATRAPP